MTPFLTPTPPRKLSEDEFYALGRDRPRWQRALLARLTALRQRRAQSKDAAEDGSADPRYSARLIKVEFGSG